VTAAEEMTAGTRTTTATAAVEAALTRIGGDGREGIWITVTAERARLAAATVDQRVAAGEALPLAGWTVAVKDNIDVAGVPTTVACPAYAYVPEVSARCVAALEGAGAVVVGKTNLDQFATGLVGTRSPYGTCPNAFWPDLVSGGSSSGSAVAVAAGHVDVALGTDTAGSGRVPAAANGILGLKPSRDAVSTAGVVPAMATLDCVSVFARSVDDADRVVGVLARSAPGPRPLPPHAQPTGCAMTLAVPDLTVAGFGGDALGPARFAAAVAALAATGIVDAVQPVDVAPFVAAGRLLYEGAFVAERYAAVGPFVEAHPDDVDPVVGPIIAAAGHVPAWRLYRDRAELERLRAETATTWDRADVLVVPSVPRLPTVGQVRAEPVRENAMLGTYTNFVNLLDLCALTIPVPAAAAAAEDPPAGPPPSVTLIAPAGADAQLVAVARALAAAADR
jgi:allophanate hydrolase